MLTQSDGPARAIRCAAAITEYTSRLGVEICTGLQTGECETVDGQVAGIAAQMCVCVANEAEPGEVLVSSTVKDLVAGSGIEFEDRGRQLLAGCGEWRLFAVQKRCISVIQDYPFADIDLARRLERTEARGNTEFVEARTRAFPDRGATWIEVAGAYAMFDGVGSPLTQTFGLGVFQPTTVEDLDTIEQFFRSRGADVFHEVCPLADPTVFALFNERGYQPIEFSNVLYRPIAPDLRLQAAVNERIRVRVIENNEMELWAETAFEGWSEFSEVADFLRELGQVTAESKSLSFLAESDGKPVATGALIIADDVALLAGASTVPSARRQGAQLALLEQRLRYAAAQGCTVAMMAADPGSGSQRNAERHGFRIAYTRTKWRLH